MAVNLRHKNSHGVLSPTPRFRGGPDGARVFSPRNRGVGRAHRRGFTLLEALLALAIFMIISFAMSLAISAVFQAQAAAQKREDEASTIRAVFGFLTRDLQAAFISQNNPASVFIGGGSQSGGAAGRTSGSGGNGSLLTLTTLAHRITMGDATLGPTGASSQEALAQPQADFELVRYDLDTTSGMLYRTVSSVPNLETIAQPNSMPQSAIAERVVSLNLRFWDAEAKGFRPDWDYQQANQAQAQNSGQAQPGAAPAPAPMSATGDTALPAAVEVTLVMQRRDGTPATFMTMIPVVAPRPSQTDIDPTPDPTGGTGGIGGAGGAGGPGGGPGGGGLGGGGLGGGGANRPNGSP